MSIKWKLPLIILVCFLFNIIILSVYYRFYLSDKVNDRLTQAQHSVEKISKEVQKEVNNKELSYALNVIKSAASEKNVSINLKKIGSEDTYSFSTTDDNSETFSASQEVILNNSFYMLTVRKLTNIPKLGNIEIVKDILYFELIIVFIMLLMLTFVLYINYAKPLVSLSDEIKGYENRKFIKLRIARKDELGQLQNSFYELMDNLKKEKQIQDRIIASISHDIKTPLTSVLGYSENLLKKELPPERKKKYLTTIYNQAKDIEGIVEEFDNYISNKLDSELQKQKYSIKYICDMLRDEYSTQLTERNVRFSVINNCNTNTSILIDLGKFRRVIANIIGNSMRHANVEKININITVCEKQSNVFFKISDNGEGVKKEDIQFIFEPFYTSDKSRRISGLGLSICRDIIETHGGKITAKNSDDGFSVTVSLEKIYNPF